MIEMEQIQALSQQIAEQFKPDRIILFGSYAYGTPNEDSDVDLLVVMPFEGYAFRQSVTIREKIRVGFPLDLLVKTPQKIQERLELGDFFIQEIFEQGKTLYESAHARVD
jgi:uncharacterized protein